MTHLNYLEKLLDGEIVEWIALGDVTLIKTGQAVSKQAISTNPGQYPVINSGKEPLGFIDKWNTDNDPIGITTRGAGVGSITWQEGKYFRGNLNYSVTIKDSANLEVRYLYHLLHQMQSAIQSLCTFDGIPALNAGSLKGLEIPIPCPDNPEKSLEIQAEIVRILDAFTAMTAELTAELNMRKKQYNYYRDQLLGFEDGEVEWKALGKIAEINTGQKPSEILDTEAEFDYINAGTTRSGYCALSNCEGDTVTTPSRGQGGIGFVGYQNKSFWLGPLCYKIRSIDNKVLINKYLFYILQSKNQQLLGLKKEGGVPAVNKSDLAKLEVPVPSVTEQERIVKILDKFDTLTTSIQEGLPCEIELRQKQYEYYRDLLLSFPKSEEAAA
ncbi:restriction endonuclease subunit S [Vibrio parahaemolyticus]|uniref:restriction endonuclease subunit S n=1 Tax=Vibrio parahaemolyticus TaxID=670 RepID=UPI00111FF014|nr:restriction endonuclease subunit S [Vibrio parahaemolyticus]MDF4676643.1 restriction endonuclease subunit S [Vibrio parahaemolyticus]MDF4700894.1 restriction endonuclease subunit S [Vibrio parahaemolyticus]TON09197.1 restriction endonuclease subunit M [Vibrio parahaemolyticus]TOO39318.1 restriction endonuclease subunit M [Vibrio parahaemolyticus]TOP25058.1 restriction endonuclease subunit M [Vibrio parahaemolyticus]